MEKIAKFNAEDPFLLSEQLTEEERMIADSAPGLCAGKFAAARHRYVHQ